MKLVLTGTAGRLESYLREPLTKMCDELISTDIIGAYNAGHSGVALMNIVQDTKKT